MKKKFILIFSLIILSVCIFAFSSSASNYYNFNNLDLSSMNTIYSNMYSLSSDCDNNQFVSSLGYDLSFVSFDFYNTNNSDFSLYSWGLLNCENWQKYIEDHNISNYDEFYLSFDKGIELGYWQDGFSFYYYLGGGYATQDLWNCYQGWLAEQNAPTYEDGIAQGKIDGVTEFKGTEEYKSQYTTGYTDGINNFKETELPEMLALEKQIGQAEGKSIYLASEEYADVLKAEYDNGYNAATNENDKTQIKNSLGVIVGSCGLVVIFLLAFYFMTSKKKYKRR